MFNSYDNKEMGFADAYKSQILHPDDKEELTFKNLIIILILIAIIIGLSIFGYSYISKITPRQYQDTKEVKEIHEIKEIEEITEEAEPQKLQMLNNIDELEENSEPIEIEGEIPKEIENIKIDEKTEVKEVKKKSEETYLEQLAELSKEIDG
ncbi:MAG: hypothetical protein KAU90_03145 [Sulfurovaceae bacterium]|nr:hypothetical protein [Sulfurovaceae bacterium]